MMLCSVTLVVKEVSEKMAGNGKSLRDEDETDSEFCVCQSLAETHKAFQKSSIFIQSKCGFFPIKHLALYL